MATGESSSDSKLPLATIIHLLTIKLSSSNYFLWRNLFLPCTLLSKPSRHIDGSLITHSKTVITDGVSSANPDFTTWHNDDQCALLIIQSSLTEESTAEVLGLKTAREV